MLSTYSTSWWNPKDVSQLKEAAGEVHSDVEKTERLRKRRVLTEGNQSEAADGKVKEGHCDVRRGSCITPLSPGIFVHRRGSHMGAQLPEPQQSNWNVFEFSIKRLLYLSISFRLSSSRSDVDVGYRSLWVREGKLFR